MTATVQQDTDEPSERSMQAANDRPVRLALTIGSNLGSADRLRAVELAVGLIGRVDVVLTLVGSRRSIDDVLAAADGGRPSREVVVPGDGDELAELLWTRYQLARILRHRRVDLIHSCSDVIPARSGCPVVLDISTPPGEYDRRPTGALGSALRAELVRRSIRDADLLLPRTPELVHELVARDGVDAQRVSDLLASSSDASAPDGGASPRVDRFSDHALDALIVRYRDVRRGAERRGQPVTPTNAGAPRIAIVNDWLLNVGGGERVTRELREMFPAAPVYTSQHDPVGFDWFDGVDVRTTWLQRLPRQLKKFLPPLRAVAFRQLDLSDYDLVLTSSSAESKSVRPRADALQITYCHSPSHYYWSRYDDYLAAPGLGRLDPIGRLGLRILASPMRTADFRAAQHADVLLVNSSHIQAEVARIYRRDSHVVHPPVDVTKIVERTAGRRARSGYVIAGRQTPYKRFDLAVLACTELARPLLVMGDGPEHERLRAVAGPTITFQREVSDDEWAALLAGAEGFLFPGKDDFGITPVEAMAAATPVIAYRAGGAVEYVEPGTTGVFFEDQTVASLVAAIEAFERIDFDPAVVRAAAERFSAERFRREMQAVIDHYLGAPIAAP